MAQSAELQAKIAIWRQRCREGTMTQEEYKEVLRELRADRVKAGEVSAASKARKSTATAKKNINSDDLLGELDGL